MIATDQLVVVGGKDQVFALDRKSGKKVWEHAVQGNAMGLAANDSTLAVSTDEGFIYAFTNAHIDQPQQWPAPYTEAFAQGRDLTEFYRQAAREILETTGQRTGYCLVAGSEEGRLAYEISASKRVDDIGCGTRCRRLWTS